MQVRRIVIVGASLAGLRAAEGLRRAGFDGELVLVGEETHQPYDRPPLSKAFMRGLPDGTSLELRQSDALAAEWMLGRRAVHLDRQGKRIELSDGSRVPYDGLVIATGSAARTLPEIPTGAAGVHLLRTLDDAVALRRELSGSPRLAVVGGGFIGSELASTCRDLGLDTTVITPLPLLAGPLGPLAEAATARARDHGVHVIEAAVVGADVGDRISGVRLDNGVTVAADVVVVAVGAVAQTGWLQGSGVQLSNGVVCDDTLAVLGLPDAVAAGDVVRWPHPAAGGALLRIEHWTNAAEQATAAAKRLLLGPGAAFAPVPSFWSDQFGIRIQGVGLTALADEAIVVDGDPAGDSFVAEYRSAGRLVGAVVGGAAGSVTALLPYRRELSRLLRAAATS